jgi:hypothetical protein
MSQDPHAPHDSGDELDDDEPRTPAWLPVLGLGLFLLAFVYALASSDATEEPGGVDIEEPSPAETAEVAESD